MNDIQVKSNNVDLHVNNKHNYKLTLEDKKAIVLDYTLNKTNTNIENICIKYNISKRTLYDILHKFDSKEVNDIVNESIKRYKQNFTKKANNIINKALDRIDNQLDNDNINISQLSTTIGILYDKTRLEDNLSTSNNSFNINIHIDK